MVGGGGGGGWGGGGCECVGEGGDRGESAATKFTKRIVG